MSPDQIDHFDQNDSEGQAVKEPFVYEGRLRVFDPEPGYEMYLLDHPKAEGNHGPGLVDEIEIWAMRSMFMETDGPRYRITVEEIG